MLVLNDNQIKCSIKCSPWIVELSAIPAGDYTACETDRVLEWLCEHFIVERSELDYFFIENFMRRVYELSHKRS